MFNKNNTNIDKKRNTKHTNEWYTPSILESYFIEFCKLVYQFNLKGLHNEETTVYIFRI